MNMPSFLQLPDVLSRVPISKSTLFRQVTAGTFPKPVRLGERRVAWVEREIAEWEKSRIAERDGASIEHAACE